MAWLSLKTIHLDAQRESDKAETELARREAELQELISSALYRMDLKMLPLVAQESARPNNLGGGSAFTFAILGLALAMPIASESLSRFSSRQSPPKMRSRESVLVWRSAVGWRDR